MVMHRLESIQIVDDCQLLSFFKCSDECAVITNGEKFEYSCDTCFCITLLHMSFLIFIIVLQMHHIVYILSFIK